MPRAPELHRGRDRGLAEHRLVRERRGAAGRDNRHQRQRDLTVSRRLGRGRRAQIAQDLRGLAIDARLLGRGVGVLRVHEHPGHGRLETRLERGVGGIHSRRVLCCALRPDFFPENHSWARRQFKSFVECTKKHGRRNVRGQAILPELEVRDLQRGPRGRVLGPPPKKLDRAGVSDMGAVYRT